MVVEAPQIQSSSRCRRPCAMHRQALGLQWLDCSHEFCRFSGLCRSPRSASTKIHAESSSNGSSRPTSHKTSTLRAHQMAVPVSVGQKIHVESSSNGSSRPAFAKILVQSSETPQISFGFGTNSVRGHGDERARIYPFHCFPGAIPAVL